MAAPPGAGFIDGRSAAPQGMSAGGSAFLNPAAAAAAAASPAANLPLTEAMPPRNYPTAPAFPTQPVLAPSSAASPPVQPLPQTSRPRNELPGERGWWGETTPANTPVRTASGAADRQPGTIERLSFESQPAQPKRVSAEQIIGQPIAEVRVAGNQSIPTWAIERLITETRAGRTVNAEQIRKDKTTLVQTRWFLSVREQVLVSDDGPIVVFEVIEAPRIERVEFIGNRKIKTDKLARETGLTPEGGYDVSANVESVQRIKELYREKGYVYADVKLEKGGDPQDREVRIVIDEGPKVVVSSISFEGNRFVSGPVLRTLLSTKTQWLLLFGGKYNADSIQADVQALTAYYEGLGFFDVEVASSEQTSSDRGRVHVTFKIQEGLRYKVRNIEVSGNDVIAREKLLGGLKLRPGDAFNTRFLQADAQRMKDAYDELGRPFASVQPTPRFLPEPGVMDIVYNIDEDKVHLIGRINIRIRGDDTHTSTLAVRHRINRYLKPGELARSKDIQAARTVVATDPIFDREEAPEFNIRRVAGADYAPPELLARGQTPLSPFETRTNLRPATGVLPVGFNADGSGPLWRAPGVRGWFGAEESDRERLLPTSLPIGADAAPTHLRGSGPNSIYLSPAPSLPPMSSQSLAPSQSPTPSLPPTPSPTRTPAPQRPVGFAPPPQHSPSQHSPSVAGSPAPLAMPLPAVATSPRGPGPADLRSAVAYVPPVDRQRREETGADDDGAEAGQLDALPARLLFSDAAEAATAADSLTVIRAQSLDSRGLPDPQNYLYQDSPQGDPFGNALRAPAPDYVDVDIDVTEGRTGRLSFGAGVNSNAGLVGNIVLQEDNFDILRFPRSWGDVLHGRAFRGGGQSFRIEAVPGTQVSRYMASWRTPYFLGTDFSFGVDGFYYNRFFENWTEDRLGGRLSLGYIINRYWTAGVALRLENVEFRDFLNTPLTPQLYRNVAGDNFLSTAQFRIAHDTRDSAFLPSKGHFVELAYEQAFGEFNYPRLDLTMSQYFTLYERADGKGKHTLQLRGETIWTGDDTPVFERLYAGGFQSFRGFAFRGVAPRENSYRIGGTYSFLGTAEYQFPITAGNMIRGVVFSDFGTVDTDIALDKFRATAGFGFRFTIPAMGPAPLAFDFAWPILSESEDTRQIFSFYIGTTF